MARVKSREGVRARDNELLISLQHQGHEDRAGQTRRSRSSPLMHRFRSKPPRAQRSEVRQIGSLYAADLRPAFPNRFVFTYERLQLGPDSHASLSQRGSRDKRATAFMLIAALIEEERDNRAATVYSCWDSITCLFRVTPQSWGKEEVSLFVALDIIWVEAEHKPDGSVGLLCAEI